MLINNSFSPLFHLSKEVSLYSRGDSGLNIVIHPVTIYSLKNDPVIVSLVSLPCTFTVPSCLLVIMEVSIRTSVHYLEGGIVKSRGTLCLNVFFTVFRGNWCHELESRISEILNHQKFLPFPCRGIFGSMKSFFFFYFLSNESLNLSIF